MIGKCFFTNDDADTEEHIIPRWIQKRFNLSNQNLMLPNGSQLKYKLAKIPASSSANNLFGKIEENISKKVFNYDEIYLWALKIHIGLIYRDSSLQWDIKDPSTSTILDANDFSQEIWIFQKLYSLWQRGGTTDPTPLGSVFIIDSLTPNEFDFVHCLTTGTIGINTGDKFILVFLWDQGDGLKSNALEHWRNHHYPTANNYKGTPEEDSYSFLSHRIWACETAYWLYKNRRSFKFVLTDKKLTLIPPMIRPEPKKADEEQYKRICKNFGLDLIEYKDLGNIYAPYKR